MHVRYIIGDHKAKYEEQLDLCTTKELREELMGEVWSPVWGSTEDLKLNAILCIIVEDEIEKAT